MQATRPLHYCDHCNKSFSRAYILRDHLNSIQGIKPYFCSTCPTTFSRRYDLKVHEKEQHSIERPTITCRVEGPDGSLGCDKVFKRKSDLLRHLRAPSGRFCRVPTLTSTAVIPFRASKSKIAGMSLHEQQHRGPSLTKANDPLSSNLLDQNKHIDWNKCLFRALVSVFLDGTTHALALCTGGGDSPQNYQSYIHTITVAKYFLKEGNMFGVLICAFALYVGGPMYPYLASPKVHERFIMSIRGRHAVGVIAFNDEHIEYAYLLMASLTNRVESQYVQLWQAFDNGMIRKEICIAATKVVFWSWSYAMRISWILAFRNSMHFRRLRDPDPVAIIKASHETSNILDLALDICLEYQANADLAACQQLSKALASLRTTIEIYNPSSWKTTGSPFPASVHIEEELC